MTFPSKRRHIVFTIPEELRDFFIRDRSLLNLLFIASRNTLCCLFNEDKFRKSKRKMGSRKSKSAYLYRDTKYNIDFGALSTLHTFGIPLEFNPHIHMLICEDGLDLKNNKIKNFSFMSYEKLRQTWRYQILDLLNQHLKNDKHFQKLKSQFYSPYKDEFYAKQPKNNQDNEDVDDVVAYITRYTNRPVMAQSRIVEYNDKTKMIHWFYNRDEDDKRIDVIERV